jgi:putative transposase
LAYRSRSSKAAISIGSWVQAPDEAWSSDITYIRLAHGSVFLTVIMDWHSRYVLSWELSTTLDKTFCVDALEPALRISKPGIYNTDQGPQYTSDEFTARLESEDITISMDERGRVYDNIFIERFWRTVKYEEVYLHEYRTVADARAGLAAYFRFCNEERFHETLGYRTPHEVYFGTPARLMPAAEAVV